MVSVDSDQDTDPANDEEEIYVVVRDYTDIEVDLCWTDGAGVCEEGDRAVGTGTESRQFLLTVTADGSQDFNPREVNVSVELDGLTPQAAVVSISASTVRNGSSLPATHRPLKSTATPPPTPVPTPRALFWPSKPLGP